MVLVIRAHSKRLANAHNAKKARTQARRAYVGHHNPRIAYYNPCHNEKNGAMANYSLRYQPSGGEVEYAVRNHAPLEDRQRSTSLPPHLRAFAI